jgi:hypothetical protein
MNAAARNDNLDDPVDELSADQRRSRRVRFELIFASSWLGFGLFLLPALIFGVGAAMLGPYGENAGLSTFYGDFYGDLADGSGRAWLIALGPLVLIYLLRAIFIGARPKRTEQELDEDELPRSPPTRAPVVRKEQPKRSAARPTRVEPRMGAD